MDYLLLACFILALMSAISSLLLILAHFVIPKLRKHPGQLILIEACLQFCLDIGYVMASEFSYLYSPNYSCTLIGIVFSTVMIQSYYFFMIFTLEVYIQIKKSIMDTHSKRCKIYYTGSLLLFIFF
jgi:hypothetical protein